MTIKPDTLRAAHLDALLDDYSAQSSPTDNLTDILADAMHWCVLQAPDWHPEHRPGVGFLLTPAGRS